MKKTLTLIALFVWASALSATIWEPTTIPLAHLEDSTRYVCNPDGILEQWAVDEIDSLMRVVEDSTRVQAAIVVVNEINPQDCYEFTFLVGEKNGIATKDDKGFTLMLCVSERCVQICTAKGVEASLPDAICRRIQEQYMNPHFKDGNWNTGMVEGCKAITAVLMKEEDGEYMGLKSDGGGGDTIFGIIGMIFVLGPIGLVIWAIRNARKQKKCPICGKCKMKRLSKELISTVGNQKSYKCLYECQNCQHQETKIETETIYTGGSSSGGSSSGGSWHSSGGSYHSSSHSSGGHYGGGHYGGGGAGSRF